MAAQTPWFLWVILTAASIAVGGAMLWIAFAAFNKRERERRQGFEVKTNTAGDARTGDRAVLREKEHHG